MSPQARDPEAKTGDVPMEEHNDPGMLSMHDPENPQKWSLKKNLHACITGWTFTFVL